MDSKFYQIIGHPVTVILLIISMFFIFNCSEEGSTRSRIEITATPTGSGPRATPTPTIHPGGVPHAYLIMEATPNASPPAGKMSWFVEGAVFNDGSAPWQILHWLATTFEGSSEYEQKVLTHLAPVGRYEMGEQAPLPQVRFDFPQSPAEKVVEYQIVVQNIWTPTPWVALAQGTVIVQEAE